MNKIFDISKKDKIIWLVMLIILLVGIFLRVWHFRDWLYFYPDQARDVMITRDYLDGKAPLPLLGPIAASTQFRIGPMYYYFQIISGKIFGVRPETMAYPDLFFSILTIPLFYFFLKRYFSANLSLALTGLFSISFFAIKYSRFAWNSNPIPFFMLLFLLSLLELLEHQEKTSWFWTIIAGISLGVGLQLHTTLFVLMPIMALLVFIYLLVKNPAIWKSGLIVFVVVLILNAGMLASEISTNFHNTRTLFKVSAEGSQNSNASVFDSLNSDNFCHVQANAYMLSSLGDKEDCTFLAVLKNKGAASGGFKNWPLDGVYISIAFSILGYLFLIYCFFREKERRKKYFLGLVILTIILSYLILLTVADSLILRYFIHLFFVPFLFLGILIDFVRKHFRIAYLLSAIIIFGLLLFSNGLTIKTEVRAYQNKDKSEQQYVVLGEIELMRDYIISRSGSHQEAYLYAEGKYMQNYFKPMFYISSERDFTILRAKNTDSVPAGESLFLIGSNSDSNKDNYFSRFKIADYKNFGQLGVYQLEN